MSNAMFYGGAFWIASIIFVTDMVVPSGVAVGLCYVVLVVLGIWAPWRHSILLGAGFGTFLTTAGFFFSPMAGEIWPDIINRFLTVVILWTVACVALYFIKSKSPAR